MLPHPQPGLPTLFTKANYHARPTQLRYHSSAPPTDLAATPRPFPWPKSDRITHAAVAHHLAESLQRLARLQVELDGADVVKVRLADGADDGAVDELHHQLVGPVVRLTATGWKKAGSTGEMLPMRE